jgi:hypothetical protein
MKKFCEKEQLVVAALRSRSLCGELLVHVSNCQFCSEVVFVMESLREDPAFAEDAWCMPDPDRIWERARGVVRENATEKAMLPIRIAQIVAYVTAILAVPWLLLELPKLPRVVPDLGLAHLALLDGSWSPAQTSITVLSVTVTLVCTGFSSWYILREQ